jgi:hypothetical protein
MKWSPWRWCNKHQELVGGNWWYIYVCSILHEFSCQKEVKSFCIDGTWSTQCPAIYRRFRQVLTQHFGCWILRSPKVLFGGYWQFHDRLSTWETHLLLDRFMLHFIQVKVGGVKCGSLVKIGQRNRYMSGIHACISNCFCYSRYQDCFR